MRTESKPHPQLSSDICIVLVQKVIHAFVQSFTMNQNQCCTTSHAVFHTLDVEAHLQISVVVGKVASKHYYGARVIKDPMIEHERERSIVACEQHQVPCLLTSRNVLCGQFHHRWPWDALRRHRQVAEERGNDAFNLIWSPTVVA